MDEFELQLKQFFPAVYELHILSKSDNPHGEQHLWDLIEQLLDMKHSNSSGTITVNYSQGHIDGIKVQKDVLAYKKQGSIDKHIK